MAALDGPLDLLPLRTSEVGFAVVTGGFNSSVSASGVPGEQVAQDDTAYLILSIEGITWPVIIFVLA